MIKRHIAAHSSSQLKSNIKTNEKHSQNTTHIACERQHSLTKTDKKKERPKWKPVKTTK